MDIVKDFILNFFLIFTCFFILIVLKFRLGQVSKLALFLVASLAVLFCITFPVRLDEDFIVDLRMIPIVAVGLYGGWPILASLMLVKVGYRFWWGGLGAYASLVIAIVMILLISYISYKFQSLSPRNRIWLSALIGIPVTILELLIVMFVFQHSIPLTIFISKLVLQTIGIFFFVLTWEMVITYKGLHERVLRTEKMEIVSHLASSFSHEVRNPMTTVKGFLQLMTDPKIDREKMNRYVSIAINEIDRAESIIKEYLTFTKPDSSENKTIDGRDLLETSVEVIRPLANASSISIILKNNHFIFEGNKQRMQQVLINLFKNAIEAMQSGGTLTVVAVTQTKWVKIIIEDTGIGMTREQINRLGEPFFSTKGDLGTGLGMMVVYHIIESMGGKIEVDSQVGKGTKFTLIIPSVGSTHQTDVDTTIISI
nr:ATP-binding protein [Bacillus pinisoli]